MGGEEEKCVERRISEWKGREVCLRNISEWRGREVCERNISEWRGG